MKMGDAKGVHVPADHLLCDGRGVVVIDAFEDDGVEEKRVML